jgi:hypothetical protein
MLKHYTWCMLSESDRINFHHSNRPLGPVVRQNIMVGACGWKLLTLWQAARKQREKKRRVRVPISPPRACPQ